MEATGPIKDDFDVKVNETINFCSGHHEKTDSFESFFRTQIEPLIEHISLFNDEQNL